MISRVIALCARRPWLVLGAAALAARRQLRRAAVAGARRDPGSLRPAHRRGRRMDGAPRDGCRGPGHPGPDRGRSISMPGSTAVRGQSMSDMAYVDVVFGSDAALAAGRAEIVRRMTAAAAAAAGRRAS